MERQKKKPKKKHSHLTLRASIESHSLVTIKSQNLTLNITEVKKKKNQGR